MAKRKSKQPKAKKADLAVQAPSTPAAEVVSISSRRTSPEKPLPPEEPTALPEEPTALPEEKPTALAEETQEKLEVKPEEKPVLKVSESPRPTRPTPPTSSTSEMTQNPRDLPESGSGVKKPVGRISRSGLPKPKKVVTITQCGEFNAGDSVTLPYSGKVVTLTNFYQGSHSGDWWAAFEGGCVQVKALKRESV